MLILNFVDCVLLFQGQKNGLLKQEIKRWCGLSADCNFAGTAGEYRFILHPAHPLINDYEGGFSILPVRCFFLRVGVLYISCLRMLGEVIPQRLFLLKSNTLALGG